MAPFPPETTARTWFRYTNGTDEHEVMFRHPEVLSASALDLVVDDWFTTLGPIIYEITILGVRRAGQGNTFSIPRDWNGAATYGADTLPANAAPIEYRFEGRGNTGRRVSWSMFSGKLAIPATYRYLTSDNTNVANCFAILSTAALASVILEITGGPPTVYPYMNYQFNSYWETNRRG